MPTKSYVHRRRPEASMLKFPHPGQISTIFIRRAAKTTNKYSELSEGDLIGGIFDGLLVEGNLICGCFDGMVVDASISGLQQA